MRFFNPLPQVLIVFLLATTTSFATETRSIVTKTRALSKASSIIHVRVVEAKELAVMYEGKLNDSCGINYSANILHSYKGKLTQGKVKFSSPYPLMIGEEYLLVIGRGTISPHLIVEFSPDYEAAVSTCAKDSYDPNLPEENDALMIWDSPYGLDGKWVMIADDGNTPVSKQLPVKKMHCLYGEGECLFVRLDDLVGETK